MRLALSNNGFRSCLSSELVSVCCSSSAGGLLKKLRKLAMYSCPALNVMLVDLSPGKLRAIFFITSWEKEDEALPVGCSGSPMNTNMQMAGRVVKRIASSSAPNCCA